MGINLKKRIKKIRSKLEKPRNFVQRSKRIGTVPGKDAFNTKKMKLPF